MKEFLGGSTLNPPQGIEPGLLRAFLSEALRCQKAVSYLHERHLPPPLSTNPRKARFADLCGESFSWRRRGAASDKEGDVLGDGAGLFGPAPERKASLTQYHAAPRRRPNLDRTCTICQNTWNIIALSNLRRFPVGATHGLV